MGPPGVGGPDDVSVPDGCFLKGYPDGDRVFIGVPSQPSEYFCPDSPVCCFPIRIIMAVCFIQENFPVFVSHPPLPGEAPQVEVAGGEEAAEDPTISPLTRKRKGKEVADPVVKKAKVSTPLLTGGALRIGGGGENLPPVIGGVGGAGPAAPAFRPAAEVGPAPPVPPLLGPTEGSAQRVAEESAPLLRVLESSAEGRTPVTGISLIGRKVRLVLRQGR